MAAIYVPQYFNYPDHLNIEHLNKGVQKVRILNAQIPNVVGSLHNKHFVHFTGGLGKLMLDES